jgi:hypothetical protein
MHRAESIGHREKRGGKGKRGKGKDGCLERLLKRSELLCS